jgi:hypothetical protein
MTLYVEQIEHIEKNCVLRTTRDLDLNVRIDLAKQAIGELEKLAQNGYYGAGWALEYIKAYNRIR